MTLFKSKLFLFLSLLIASLPAKVLAEEKTPNEATPPSEKLNDIDSLVDDSQTDYSVVDGSSRINHRIILQADGIQFNPSGLQATVGDTNTPFIGFGFDLEYEALIRNTFGWSFRVGTYSLTRVIAGSSNSSFTINGYLATANLVFRLFHRHDFSLELRGGQGVSLNSADVTVSAQQTSTSYLLGFPIRWEVKTIVRMIGNLDLSLGAGYEIHSLSNVPVIAVSQNGSNAVTNTSVNLNALFVNLGLGFQF